jgi:hypothetical protein
MRKMGTPYRKRDNEKPNKKSRKVALFGDRSESPISKESNYLVFSVHCLIPSIQGVIQRLL